MDTYAVKLRWTTGDATRLSAAAEQVPRLGPAVRWVRSVYTPEQGTCLLVFEAPTPELADATARMLRAMSEPGRIDFSALTAVSHDADVYDREADVDGTRWALVEYAPGAGRAEWCETPHSGVVLSGALTYSFEDGREPLRLGPGDGFVLPEQPRHRGRNEGAEPARLFLIDALT